MSNNAGQTDFQDNSKGLISAPTVSLPLVKTTQYLFPASSPNGAGYPRSFYMKEAGNFVFKDALGVTDTYPVLASQVVILENVTEVTAANAVDFSAQY